MTQFSSETLKEGAKCILCKTRELKYAFVAKDRNRQVNNQLFTVFQCPSCGLGYTFPRLPDFEISHYYPPIYYGLSKVTHLEAIPQTRKYTGIRVERIRKYILSGRLLDIGAGTGIFLKRAREVGFQTEGLEISKDAAEFGRKVWDLDIRQGDFYQAAFQNNQYDVVTLWHVFEHLYDPLQAIKRIYDILKLGGLLVLAVPNSDSIQARTFLHRWFHLDIPRHMFHYTPTALQTITERAGFKTIEINFFSSEHNWAGILGSIMRLSPPEESLFHKAIRKIIGTPFARCAAYLEALVNKGGTFELYARKL